MSTNQPIYYTSLQTQHNPQNLGEATCKWNMRWTCKHIQQVAQREVIYVPISQPLYVKTIFAKAELLEPIQKSK